MKKIFEYNKRQALCSNPREASDFINSLPGITCNAHAEKILSDLFAGTADYHGRSVFEIATTGCGLSRIRVFDALADTLEDHQAIYDRKCSERKAERIRDSKRAQERRMEELNVQRRGWYNVSITFDVRIMRFEGNDGTFAKEFSGDIVAESGMDAYRKLDDHINKTIEKDCIDHGVLYQEHFLPDPTSGRFFFQFLGMKTDDGYSIEAWEEWNSRQTR